MERSGSHAPRRRSERRGRRPPVSETIPHVICTCDSTDPITDCFRHLIHRDPLLPEIPLDSISVTRPPAEFTEGPPRILLAGGDDWWVRSIVSTLKPFAVETLSAPTSEIALELLALSHPEGALVHLGRDPECGVDLVRQLRSHGLGAECPILVVADEAIPRHIRLSALRAGAWDCVSPPISGEELVLKLRAYLRATRVVSAARKHALLDEASGLYNIHGILRWARELGNAARRHGRPLGCAVFAPVDAIPAAPGTTEGRDGASQHIALRLTSLGRGSDIVGRISANEFVVLAPDAGPGGILAMAHRFVGEGAGTGRGQEVRLRAGCFAVANVAAEAVEPAELIGRATLALRRAAQSASPDPVEFFSGGMPNAN